jgi:hypothetical protein
VLILVTYKPAPGQSDRTSSIQQAIAQHAAGHIQPLSGCWLVDTDEALDTWVARFGGPGRLVIVRVQTPPTGYLPQEMWDWITHRMT